MSNQINNILASTAIAAGRVCGNGPANVDCGFQWTSGVYDRRNDMPTQWSALSVFAANIAKFSPPSSHLVTGSTGGTLVRLSKDYGSLQDWLYKPATWRDKLLASVITIVTSGGALGAGILIL
jgi:hypothetical protein